MRALQGWPLLSMGEPFGELLVRKMAAWNPPYLLKIAQPPWNKRTWLARATCPFCKCFHMKIVTGPGRLGMWESQQLPLPATCAIPMPQSHPTHVPAVKPKIWSGCRIRCSWSTNGCRVKFRVVKVRLPQDSWGFQGKFGHHICTYGWLWLGRYVAHVCWNIYNLGQWPTAPNTCLIWEGSEPFTVHDII